MWSAALSNVVERANSAVVAARLTAPEGYRWRDITLDEVRPLYTRLREWRGGEPMFNSDLRPHDDQYRILEPMRASTTGSATVEVGGALTTGWFTDGDGGFPVYRDLAADGDLAASTVMSSNVSRRSPGTALTARTRSPRRTCWSTAVPGRRPRRSRRATPHR